MKIIYLVNALSKTSVPVIWASYMNNFFSKSIIHLVAIKNISLMEIKRIYNFNILHGHHIKAMAIFLFFNILLRKKTIYTVHGSYLYLSPQNQKLLKYIFKKTDKVVFVNKYLYDVLPNELQDMIEHKYKIILNGVDIRLDYKKVDVYSKFNIKETDIVIFHPARFVKEKNHIQIIEAFKLFRENNSNVKLVLAGDGMLKSKITAKIDELELEESVILLGLIDREEVYNFLEKCDLFIMPSISEGLNIAFLEAMSMKTKVLVSDIKQFTYPFKHYNLNPIDFNVYFANPNSKDDISKGFARALQSKKKIDFSMDNFSLDNMIREYELTYKELLQ